MSASFLTRFPDGTGWGSVNLPTFRILRNPRPRSIGHWRNRRLCTPMSRIHPRRQDRFSRLCVLGASSHSPVELPPGWPSSRLNPCIKCCFRWSCVPGIRTHDDHRITAKAGDSIAWCAWPRPWRSLQRDSAFLMANPCCVCVWKDNKQRLAGDIL